MADNYEWNPGKKYVPDEFVIYRGIPYKSIAESENQPPGIDTTEFWISFSQSDFRNIPGQTSQDKKNVAQKLASDEGEPGHIVCNNSSGSHVISKVAEKRQPDVFVGDASTPGGWRPLVKVMEDGGLGGKIDLGLGNTPLDKAEPSARRRFSTHAGSKDGEANMLMSTNDFGEYKTIAQADGTEKNMAVVDNYGFTKHAKIEDVINHGPETVRAKAAEKALDDKIDKESERAKAEEKSIADDLTEEIKRAKEAESEGGSVKDETKRAKAAEGVNSDNISINKASIISKEERAIKKENELQANIDKKANIDDLDKKASIEDLTKESKRATDSEVVIAASVSAESTRAKKEEGDETKRAKAAESAITLNVQANSKSNIDEAARAKAEEKIIKDSVVTENLRATASEAGIVKSVTDEAGRATAAEGAIAIDVKANAKANTDETVRAKAEEKVIKGLVAAEESRAKGEESTNKTDIGKVDAKVDLKANNDLTGVTLGVVAEITDEKSVVYDSTNKKLVATDKTALLGEYTLVSSDASAYFSGDPSIIGGRCCYISHRNKTEAHPFQNGTKLNNYSIRCIMNRYSSARIAMSFSLGDPKEWYHNENVQGEVGIWFDLGFFNNSTGLFIDPESNIKPSIDVKAIPVGVKFREPLQNHFAFENKPIQTISSGIAYDDHPNGNGKTNYGWAYFTQLHSEVLQREYYGIVTIDMVGCLTKAS